MDSPADSATSERKKPTMAPARTTRQSHDARVRFWRVFVVSVFFAIILSANLFVGATILFGNIWAQVSAEKDTTSSKTARITRPLLDGTFCRHMVIDNSSGNTIEDRVARCDSINGKPKKIQARTEFTWGGR